MDWLVHGEGKDNMAEEKRVKYIMLGACRRCGPAVTEFCKKIHAQRLEHFEAHDNAPQTELIHTYYQGNWQLLADLQGIEQVAYNPRPQAVQ